MLRASMVKVFAVLLLGMSAVGVAGTAAAAPNPESNIPLGALPPSCSEAPLSASCEGSVVGYLNDAHHDLGLAPYQLPSSFLTLSPAKQVLVLSDLDRSAYGISPVLGLNDTLDAAAAEGVTNNGDPRAPSQLTPGGTVFGWGSNWAGGFANVLVAYYLWMYDDGYGSPNRDCSSPGAPGCWGHRQNVLLSFGSAPPGWISMGAAAGSYPSHAGYAMLVVYTREQPAYSYTWATAVAEGAGREEPPAVVTGSASSLRTGSATLNATVNPEGQTVGACHFEYGASEAYGSVAQCSEAPGSGTTAVAVAASIAGLKAGASYHFRIVAASAAGTTHGEDHKFTTPAGPQEEVRPPTSPSATGSPSLRAPDAHITDSAGAAELASMSLTARPSGLVRIRVRCAEVGAPCTGTIVLRTLTAVASSGSGSHGAPRGVALLTLGTASFTTAGGRTAFDLHLTAAARRLIARVRVLRALVTIRSRDNTGRTHTARSVVTLRAWKRIRRT